MYLDLEIRNWILIPIMVIMISVGLITHYLNSAFVTPPTLTLKSQIDKYVWKFVLRCLVDICYIYRSLLLRSKNLRTQAKNLPLTSLIDRRSYLIGKFQEANDINKRNAEANANVSPMEDPKLLSNMKEMLTKYMASIIPQTIIMTSINFFFSGLIIGIY